MTTQVVFDTLSQVSGGLPGTASRLFTATTDQLASVITTAGAVADLVATGRLQVYDIVMVNYDMDGTPGQATYTVTATSSGSLVNYATAAGYLLSANNLSDVLSASTSRTNLGLAIGTNVQAYNAALQSISGLTTAADKMIYTTASNVYAVTDLTAFGRSLIDDASAAAALVTLGAQAKANIIAQRTADIGGGGAGPLTVVNASCATTSVITASIQTSSNAVSIQKVTAGNGSFTVLFSGDPGASCFLNYHLFVAAQ